MQVRKSFTLFTSTVLWIVIIVWTISEVTNYYGATQKYHDRGRVVFVVLFICFFFMYAVIASNYLVHYKYISWFNLETNPNEFLQEVVTKKPILENVVTCLNQEIGAPMASWTIIERVEVRHSKWEDSSPPIQELKGQFVDLTLTVNLELSQELQDIVAQQKKELEEKHKYESCLTVALQFVLPGISGTGITVTKKIGFINGRRPFYFNRGLRNVLFFLGLGIYLDLYIESRTEECIHSVTKKLYLE